MDAVRAIVWKEYRELLRQPGNLVTSGWRVNGVTFLIIGIFLALRFPLPTSGALWGLAMGSVGGFLGLFQAADTVAGERERHTLDTLLSTNIPGAALFAGKVAAVTLYGWTLGFVALVGMLAAGTVKAMVQGAGTCWREVCGGPATRCASGEMVHRVSLAPLWSLRVARAA